MFIPEKVNATRAVASFDDISFDEAVLDTNPDRDNFQYRLWNNLQLFVTSELRSVFEKLQLFVPMLSHT
ncbi:Uncharacterised protein [Chryseobacterium nakagawai]|uniref:Uncharacterized protein n=1 Tax=Chryseobacterium nakagawai TaxID=1241982 RepID=A0AAD0YR30_CHRNA|nr:hypothetical protein [Chryseobacterium nakagawai]AZA93582.1 hypothetical protein EG343_24740 [Chryseobacterium nakagawai]VEH20282.1 Uncharacterised protein [Chryseobacterium nakagawai]